MHKITLKNFIVPAWKTTETCQVTANIHINGRTEVWLTGRSSIKNMLTVLIYEPITPLIKQQIDTFEYDITRINTGIIINVGIESNDKYLAEISRCLALEFSAYDIVFNVSKYRNFTRLINVEMSCKNDITGKLLRQINSYVTDHIVGDL